MGRGGGYRHGDAAPYMYMCVFLHICYTSTCKYVYVYAYIHTHVAMACVLASYGRDVLFRKVLGLGFWPCVGFEGREPQVPG